MLVQNKEELIKLLKDFLEFTEDCQDMRLAMASPVDNEPHRAYMAGSGSIQIAINEFAEVCCNEQVGE